VAYRLLWAGKGSAALQELDADLSTELLSWKTILEDVAELDEKDGLVEIASSDALQIYGSDFFASSSIVFVTCRPLVLVWQR
jgi:hypothetical protein